MAFAVIISFDVSSQVFIKFLSRILALILVRVQVEVNNPRPSADSFDFRVV